MDEAAVRRRLAIKGLQYTDPTKRQVRLLARLSAIYEEAGVLDKRGRALALHSNCPSKDSCWARGHGREPVSTKLHGPCEDGSIFWPWIGREYRPGGGVCVLALNINHQGGDWSGLVEEFAINKWQEQEMHTGNKHPFGHSEFAYGSMTAVAAVLDSIDGRPVRTDRAPEELAPYFDRVARLQSVKCSPSENRSNPGKMRNDMLRQCPPRFLARELKVLRPRYLLVLGNDAWDAIHKLGFGTMSYNRSGIRSVLTVERRCMEVIWAPHPSSYGTWPKGLKAMIRSLRAKPLRNGGSA